MKYLPILLLLCGCCLNPYDPTTRTQIAHTIEYERKNFQMCLDAVRDGILDPVEMESLVARHQSEVARLEAWIQSEAAKEVK